MLPGNGSAAAANGGEFALVPSAADERSWLLTGRVTPPVRPPHYFRRTELIESLQAKRIAVLTAPAGFGKTSLLADICRRERGEGVLSAWLTLADDDAPEILAAYLLYAFERAGLDVSTRAPSGEPGLSLSAARAVTALARAIEWHAAPSLLILDEAERLPAGRTLEVINTLLRHQPDNLRIAVACRRNPGLDLEAAVLNGRAIRVAAEELRFSTPEIARFFSLDLPRATLQRLAERTEGWPVALQLYRNLRAGAQRFGPVGDLRGDRGIAANFLGARLLRDLSRTDREFVLDLALFDWIDAALVDEVLGAPDLRLRLDSLPELNGLLVPVEGGSGVMRLHPLLKDFCAARRFREDPERFRRLQGEIARALAQRGYPLEAVRHARGANDDRLVGEILERAGGVRLFLVEGILRLRAIDHCLTPALLAEHPRLGLLRCITLVRQGRIAEANALLEELRGRTRDFTRDRAGGDVRRLHAERVAVESLIAIFGCLPVGAPASTRLTADLAAVADDEANDPAVRGISHVLVGAANQQRARFEASRRHCRLAIESYRRCDAVHGTALAELHTGIALMAEGNARDAADCYARGRRTLKRRFPGDVAGALFADALAAELSLERNRVQSAYRLAPDPAAVRETVAWLDVYAAVYGVATERTLAQQGAADALALLDEASLHARQVGLPSLWRYLAALRVPLLVAEGDIERAESEWRAEGFPETAPEILDLSGQTWREMEAVADARIRWLTACGALDDARSLASALGEAAARHGLGRTLMRSLVATMIVEQEAGNTGRAVACLREFLARLPRTDYLRPLVREPAAGALLLRRLLAAEAAPETRDTAEAVLAHLTTGKPETSAGPGFTPRELEVLQLLSRGASDREIAAELGLGGDGVRYHLKNIYRKTRAKGRTDAVRLARSLGVVS